MTIDRLTALSGALALPDLATAEGKSTPEGDHLAERVAAVAERFLIAGGHLTLTEWESLSPASREILFQKSIQMERDRADLIAFAIIRAQMNPAAALGRAPTAEPAPHSEGP